MCYAIMDLAQKYWRNQNNIILRLLYSINSINVLKNDFSN